jgi:hypothetical protein
MSLRVLLPVPFFLYSSPFTGEDLGEGEYFSILREKEELKQTKVNFYSYRNKSTYLHEHKKNYSDKTLI